MREDPGVGVSEAKRSPAGGRRWLLPVAVGIAGALIGAAGALVVPSLVGSPQRAPRVLPAADENMKSAAGKGPIDLKGKLGTSLRDFSLKDREGHTVLSIGEAKLHADLDAIAGNLVRLPGGRVEHVALLLRRGKTGKVSLGEVLGRDDTKKNGTGPELDIGPLDVHDIRLTVSLSDNPVILQIDQAKVRVQRKPGQNKPRLYLSDIRGHLISPDPLPQPIAMRGGHGMVDLNGSPLVDLRVRGCIGDSELRMHIEVPERREGADMTLDTEGALANTAALALQVVSKFKPEKIRVTRGPVEVAEAGTCNRESGTQLRARIEKAETKPDAKATAPQK